MKQEFQIKEHSFWEKKSKKKLKKRPKNLKFDFLSARSFCVEELDVKNYACELPTTRSTHRNQNLRFWTVAFEKVNVSKNGQKIEILLTDSFDFFFKSHKFLCKKVWVQPVMPKNFPILFSPLKSKSQIWRVIFEKVYKKPKIFVNFSPLHFFEGCIKRGKVKRAQEICRHTEEWSDIPLVLLFLKIVSRVFETNFFLKEWKKLSKRLKKKTQSHTFWQTCFNQTEA